MYICHPTTQSSFLALLIWMIPACMWLVPHGQTVWPGWDCLYLFCLMWASSVTLGVLKWQKSSDSQHWGDVFSLMLKWGATREESRTVGKLWLFSRRMKARGQSWALLWWQAPKWQLNLIKVEWPFAEYLSFLNEPQHCVLVNFYNFFNGTH